MGRRLRGKRGGQTSRVVSFWRTKQRTPLVAGEGAGVVGDGGGDEPGLVGGPGAVVAAVDLVDGVEEALDVIRGDRAGLTLQPYVIAGALLEEAAGGEAGDAEDAEAGADDGGDGVAGFGGTGGGGAGAEQEGHGGDGGEQEACDAGAGRGAGVAGGVEVTAAAGLQGAGDRGIGGVAQGHVGAQPPGGSVDDAGAVGVSGVHAPMRTSVLGSPDEFVV
jgi:hypothetical protein